MKYWRGYLIAAILTAITIALRAFARTHIALMDAFYPYVSRLIESYLAQWSGGVGFCVWQILVLVMVGAVLATFVLVFVKRWSILQWLGWVLTGVSVLLLLNTGIYGLNTFSGPIAEDIHLKTADYPYTVTELTEAVAYYRDKANLLADSVPRDGKGNVDCGDFETLAQQVGDGFYYLTNEKHFPVFAGTREPVKKLGWSFLYTTRSSGGVTFSLTGEAAVKENQPAVFLPYVMCREMAHRMCIVRDGDDDFAAFLAAKYNSNICFCYSGYLMAYRTTLGALQEVCKTTGENTADILAAEEKENLRHDLDALDDYLRGMSAADSSLCDLLVQWQIQEIVLPEQGDQSDKLFDPKDPTQVDLSGIVNAQPAQ